MPKITVLLEGHSADLKPWAKGFIEAGFKNLTPGTINAEGVVATLENTTLGGAVIPHENGSVTLKGEAEVLANDATRLCSYIEALPASIQQTVVSIHAANLAKKLRARVAR